MTNRRFWLTLIVIVSVLAALSALARLIGGDQRPETDAEEDASVYSAGARGAMGWRRAIAQSGVQESVWREDFAALARRANDPATLVMIAPSWHARVRQGHGEKSLLASDDQQRLLRWTAAGNTLIWLDDFSAPRAVSLLRRLSGGRLAPDEALPDGLAQRRPHETRTRRRNARGIHNAHPETTLQIPPGAPAVLAAFVRHPLKTQEGTRLQTRGQGANAPQILLTDAQGRPLFARVALGRGSVIAGAAADFASNRYLLDARAGNLQFLTNLLALENKPALINEYIHGYGATPDLLRYYMRTPLADAARTLALLALLALWLAARPWRPTARPRESSAGEENRFAQALAWQYRKTRAPHLALGPQIQALSRAVATRFGLDLHDETAHAAIIDRLSALGGDEGLADLSPQALRRLLAMARALGPDAPPVSDAALLRFSQHLTRVQEILTHGRIRRAARSA